MHTPTPWTYERSQTNEDDQGQIKGADGKTVCEFGDTETYYNSAGRPPGDEDRAFMFRAVNSHAALVAALETAIPLVASIVTTDGSDTPVYPAVIAAARAALAAAKGE